MTQQLTAQALWLAVRSKRPAPGLILHSDRGSQYGADDYPNHASYFDERRDMMQKWADLLDEWREQVTTPATSGEESHAHAATN
jgi:hypothetical protein